MTIVAAILLVILVADHGIGPSALGSASSARTKIVEGDLEHSADLPHDSSRAAMRRWLAESEQGRRFADAKLPDERIAATNATGWQRENLSFWRGLMREANIDRGNSEQLKLKPSTSRENVL